MVSVHLVENGIFFPLLSDPAAGTQPEVTRIGSRNVYAIVNPPIVVRSFGSDSTNAERCHWAIFVSDESLSREGFRRVVSIFNRSESTPTHIRLGFLYHMAGNDSDRGTPPTLNEVRPFKTEHLVGGFPHCSIAHVGTTMLNDNEIGIHGVLPLVVLLTVVGWRMSVARPDYNSWWNGCHNWARYLVEEITGTALSPRVISDILAPFSLTRTSPPIFYAPSVQGGMSRQCMG
jgi:hypothetical protein